MWERYKKERERENTRLREKDFNCVFVRLRLRVCFERVFFFLPQRPANVSKFDGHLDWRCGIDGWRKRERERENNVKNVRNRERSRTLFSFFLFCFLQVFVCLLVFSLFLQFCCFLSPSPYLSSSFFYNLSVWNFNFKVFLLKKKLKVSLFCTLVCLFIKTKKENMMYRNVEYVEDVFTIIL